MLVEGFGRGLPSECLSGPGVQGVSDSFDLFGRLSRTPASSALITRSRTFGNQQSGTHRNETPNSQDVNPSQQPLRRSSRSIPLAGRAVSRSKPFGVHSAGVDASNTHRAG